MFTYLLRIKKTENQGKELEKKLVPWGLTVDSSFPPEMTNRRDPAKFKVTLVS